ncbi:MAG: HAD-IIIC family phosphatase, partial [Lachnospiraceae bacterium]|nr:HAD-IIIC family phosphatase [Lachnospiraceae bacterium]
MPVALNALPAVAQSVTDVLCAMQGRLKKCVVLDLDNTLWGGVIGDDGLNGIEIGELGKGHVFTNLQRWLKELKDFGIILAVCSKNDEAVAKEPFEKHEDMVLRLSDISVFVANWEDKATNIKLIQETLNIGMDSIVFLDDNAFERNLVREKCEGITVPELPEDPAEWLNFLQRENYFETASFTGVSEDRTAQYQAEFQRRQSEASYDSIDDYLASLEMVAHAEAFDAGHTARIAQLTQRSNQFNLRTVRYTEEEVAELMRDDRVFTRYYTLRDKFGDHGLIALAILRRTDDETMFVDTWLMSCRVLKRTMEAFVVNDLVALAHDAGCTYLAGEYLPTAKNKMVSAVYDDFGFARKEETPDGAKRYTLTLDDYMPQKTFIQKG